jgi:eukaryotic-like serine/threonine-protein kinase
MVPTQLGRYELVAELARGGMAELFVGRLVAIGFAKIFAIKRILPHPAQDKQFTQMFLDEGRIAGRLNHPNICQVFELGEVDGQLYLVMEYLEGVSLDELTSHGRVEPRVIAGILAQAAEGLHYAHTLRDHTGAPTPVVHRDVSPQNLFVTVDGVCKLLDFGVSKITTDPSRTKSGVIKGKLPYMAPEQIRGDQVDGRADVFSLGVCAWEALAGERLFDRPSDYLTWQAITEEPVTSLATKWSGPAEVVAVVHRALARTPAERQVSAQVFADELRGALGFASPAEIAATVRATCGVKLAARSQLVSAAYAGVSTWSPVSATPVTEAGATLDLKPASSMQLREHGAVLERPTVPARPSQPPPVSAVHAPVPAPRRSRVGWIVVVALLAAALAVAITVLVVRGGRPAAPVVVEVDAGNDPLDEGLDQLRKLDKLKDLGKLKAGLEQMRDDLQAIRPDDDDDDDDTGRLKLTTTDEATIYEGDTQLGTTPLDIELPVGSHVLRVVYGDGRERTTTVEIRARKTTHARPGR